MNKDKYKDQTRNDLQGLKLECIIFTYTWTYNSKKAINKIIKSNQIKFISSKPKHKITQTKTIRLVSYGARKVLERH